MIKNFSLIEQRADKAEPYEQALTDIYSCYCHQREQLIGPGVFSSFADLKDGRDVCGLGKFTSSIRIINFRFDKKNHRISFFKIIFCEFQDFSKNEFYKKYTCKFVIWIVSDFFSVRASCAFMLHVCQDEHQLFRHFFNNTSQVLDDMLERLCQGLLISNKIQIIVDLRAL